MAVNETLRDWARQGGADIFRLKMQARIAQEREAFESNFRKALPGELPKHYLHQGKIAGMESVLDILFNLTNEDV